MTTETKKPTTFPAYCDPANEFRGRNYDRSLDTAEIAKRIRKEITSLKKNGTVRGLPRDAKISVRIDRFSGGSSIDVIVKYLPYNPLNVDRVKWEKENPHTYVGSLHSMDAAYHRYNEDGRALKEFLEELLNSYNRDNSDIMTDYFDVNFYGHVRFDYTFERECQEKIEARLNK